MWPNVLTPKRHFLAWKHAFWATKRKNRSNGLICARARKKLKGQDSQQRHNIFHLYRLLYFSRNPHWTDFTKICMAVVVPDAITCAKFRIVFSGTKILPGSHIRLSCWFLNLRICSGDALPVILITISNPLTDSAFCDGTSRYGVPDNLTTG